MRFSSTKISATWIICLGFCLGWALLFGSLAYLRLETVHNETFDLAMYTRMAWGYGHVNLYDPFVHAWFLGVHISPVLLPLGLLGWMVPMPFLLLGVQALVMALAAWPLAAFAQRRLGSVGVVLATAMWLLHPNLGHVASFEFHPGSLAVLPMAWAIDAFDRQDRKAFLWSCVGILCCREDFALITIIFGLLAWQRGGALKSLGKKLSIRSGLYFLLFSLVLLPVFGPIQGSLHAHFGSWGQSLPQVAFYLVSHPLELIRHLLAPERALYVPKLLLSVGLLFPLLSPKWLLLTLPTIAINLISVFPNTTSLDSHYLTPALPFLVAASLDGLGVSQRFLNTHRAKIIFVPALMMVLCVSVAFAYYEGEFPFSKHFDRAQFSVDENTILAKEIIARIDKERGVQAPDALLAHVAERDRVHRGPPPDLWTHYIVLDIRYRQKFPNDGTVLRTEQDPIVRAWLANPGYGISYANKNYVLLEAGKKARGNNIAKRYLELQDQAPKTATRLSRCLSVINAKLENDHLKINFKATDACEADLAVRIGWQYKPPRVDLLFDGLLSPAHLRSGDIVTSMHPISPYEKKMILRHGLRIGLIRQSGARPEPDNPDAVDVPFE
ncbi:MAG: DUF2079 domain-containing protein [Myxococcales bacterium]|nr:MAG: DUF2079 domain-containing protein [Myxococcales bacterium]